MNNAIKLHRQALDIVNRMMEREGVLDEEDEQVLDEWVKGSGDELEALRAAYHRSASEAEYWKREADRATQMRKRAESCQVLAKAMGRDLMLDRQEMGEKTSVPGVGHIRTSKSLIAPDDYMDWPAAYLKEQDPKLDRAGALKALKSGKDLGEGFRLESRIAMVYR